jgi:hypothetical protein
MFLKDFKHGKTGWAHVYRGTTMRRLICKSEKGHQPCQLCDLELPASRNVRK